MELWHEVEATVIIVTHSIAEAVYLGDRVWIMHAGPGRDRARVRGRRSRSTRDSDADRGAARPGFKAAVDEVGRAFREVESQARGRTA